MAEDGADPHSLPPPWTPDGARQVADAFLRHAGMGAARADLIRFYQNALFHLPDDGLAVRVYGPEDALNKARSMVSFAHLLEDLDFPAVRLSPHPEAQPVEILGRQVSVWTWIDRDDRAGRDFRAFGSLLRRLHTAVGTTAITTAPFDPKTKIARRLERLRSGNAIPDAHLHVLKTAFDRASACAEQLGVADGASVVLHGDALIGNTVASSGKLLLIDFDSVGYGHPAWDLAPTLVSARRLRRSEKEWSDFLDGYGPGPATMPEIEAAAVVKQLSMTVALCFNRGFSDAVDDELDHRIRCWADWDFETPWRSPSLRPPPDAVP